MIRDRTIASRTLSQDRKAGAKAWAASHAMPWPRPTPCPLRLKQENIATCAVPYLPPRTAHGVDSCSPWSIARANSVQHGFNIREFKHALYALRTSFLFESAAEALLTPLYEEAAVRARAYPRSQPRPFARVRASFVHCAKASPARGTSERSYGAQLRNQRFFNLQRAHAHAHVARLRGKRRRGRQAVDARGGIGRGVARVNAARVSWSKTKPRTRGELMPPHATRKAANDSRPFERERPRRSMSRETPPTIQDVSVARTQFQEPNAGRHPRTSRTACNHLRPLGRPRQRARHRESRDRTSRPFGRHRS